MDPKERLELLDAEGIDAVVLYTTVGLLWEAELDDPELSQAYTRAYNRWICEFCADSPRLVPTAHLSLSDPVAAAAELERAVGEGAQGRLRRAVHPRRTPARAPRQRPGVRRRPGPRRAVRHPPHLRAAVDQGQPHGRLGERASSSGSSRRSPRPTGCATSSRRCSTTACSTGSPQLKVLVLESGGGWIGYWLDRIDAVYGHTFIGTRVPLERKPSDYFRERIWISCDPDERTIPALAERFGADRFMWASDFPHADHTPEYLADLEELAGAFPDEGDRRALPRRQRAGALRDRCLRRALPPDHWRGDRTTSA